MNQQNDQLSESILEQARAWFVRADTGDLGVEEDAFIQWFTAKVAHQIAFAEIEQLWFDLGMLPEPSIMDQEVKAQLHTINVKSPSKRNTLMGWSIIFWSLVAVMAGVVFRDDIALLFKSDYRTFRGEQELVYLPDGSQMLLNTDTAINLLYTAKERRIELIRGEAYFAALPKAKRPFIVVANGIETEVVEGNFNVRLYEQGLVEIGAIEYQVTIEDSSIKDSKEIKLQKNEVVQVDSHNFSGIKMVTPETLKYWRDKRVVFNEESLGDALKEINRYYTGMILPWDEQLTEIEVTGEFKTDQPLVSLEELLEHLGLKFKKITPFLIVVFKSG